MSSNSSQYFEAAQGVGDCNSFHVRAEQLSDSSYPVKAVKEFENGACPNSKELLNVSERNFTVFCAKEDSVLNASKQNGTNHQFKEKPFLNTIKPFDSTKVRNGNSCHLKDEFVAFMPKHTEASGARNFSSSHSKDTHPGTLQQFVAVNEVSEAAKEVRIGASCHSDKESLPNASQIVEALEAIQTAKSIQNNEPRSCISQDTEIDREVKNNSDSSRKVERTEPESTRREIDLRKQAATVIIHFSRQTLLLQGIQ